MSYCTLAEARAEIKAQTTVSNNLVQQHIRTVSRRIDTLLAPRGRLPLFEPSYKQQAFILTPTKINSNLNVFYFDAPLLSLTELKVNTTDVTSSLEAYPLLETPIRALRFVDNARWWYEFCRGNNPSYVYITGLWGISTHYDTAWETYDTIQTNPMAPGDTTFLVADVDGADQFGITPRFSPGQLIRMGTEAELMLVTDTNTATNQVTVKREVNGTSVPAGNYAAGSDVNVFQVEEPIRRVVARQVALMIARQGAFQIETLDGVGAISYPQDLLPELQQVLTEYMYV